MKKYGVYNTVRNCFQFRICEDTPTLAIARLAELIGDAAKNPKFEARLIPKKGTTKTELITKKGE